MFRVTVIFMLAFLFGDVAGGEKCLCVHSDAEIRIAASYNAPDVEIFTAGSCLNQSQYTLTYPWAHIFPTGMKHGFIHLNDYTLDGDCNGQSSCGNDCHRKSKRVYHRAVVWGDWSACSTTCGTGSQERHCHHCPNLQIHTETRTCSLPACPVWSDWGTCSVTCSYGTQTRHCLQHCTHLQEVTETRKCHNGPCPHWTDWGSCSVTCGSGTQSRHCKNYCHAHHYTIETRQCHRGACAEAVWSDWGDCSATCGSGHMRRHCLSNCHGVHTNDVQTCNYGPCPSVIQGSAHVCDKMAILHALAEINTTSVTHCPDRWTSKTENFLMANCPGIPPDASLWHKGLSVAVECNTTRQLPPYTPVGTFWNDTYQQDRLHEGYSGVFLACTQHGFKMAIQACAGVPTVIDLPHNTGTGQTDDSKHPNLPSRYFTVRW